MIEVRLNLSNKGGTTTLTTVDLTEIINSKISEREEMTENKYEQEYSEEAFWDKVKKFAKVAGESVLEPALKMYYASLDKDTPLWAKTVIIGALGYFISPVDAIPDIAPIIGYTDDLGVLAMAVATVAAHIKDEHAEKAKSTLVQWLG